MKHPFVTVHVILAILAVSGLVKATRRGTHKHIAKPEVENRYSDPCSAESLDDIAVEPEDLLQMGSHTRGRRAARRNELWSFGVVPYEIDASSGYTLDEQAVILGAIREWEKHTCLTFIPKRDSDKNYIRFYNGSCGCRSYVGVQGGDQGICLGPGCVIEGIVLHEIGHAVGYWHEHQRPDRDSYIEVVWNNIIPKDQYYFNICKSEEIDSHGETYDYESIMHYGSNAFAVAPGLQTIRPLQPGVVIVPVAGKDSLSAGDVQQTNKVYNCPAQCGGILISSSGEFSPQRGSFCEWRIRVERGYYIKLRLITSSPRSSRYNHCQYIVVKETVVSQVYGRYCVDGKNHIVESNSSRLYVSFAPRLQTSRSTAFVASYTTTCDKNFEAATGRLESPHFPSDYPPDAECVWVITGKGRIYIKFDVFDLESSSGCTYDYVEFRDGETSGSRLIRLLCGEKHPKVLLASGDKLLIRFKSDSSVQKTGFSLSWQSIGDPY